jgi:drug/metabolite transporter (DMT)-like permease
MQNRFQGLGSILGYLEVMGVMVFSFFERIWVGEQTRKVKASSYVQLTGCLLGSSYLSTVGLDYINYPTKVVFRSCKLIPTMAVALVMNKERFSATDITCAIAICTGLAMFAFADMTSVSKVSTVFGMALQASSTVADAFLPNLQQALFKQGASTLEVTYYTNLYVFCLMTLMGGGSGHLVGAFAFVKQNVVNGMCGGGEGRGREGGTSQVLGGGRGTEEETGGGNRQCTTTNLHHNNSTTLTTTHLNHGGVFLCVCVWVGGWVGGCV